MKHDSNPKRQIDLMEEAEKIAKEKLKNAEPGHDWYHTKRVLSLASKIASKERADLEVVKLSAIFHDFYRDRREHPRKGAEFAERFMRSHGYTSEKIRKVKRAILSHHTEYPGRLRSVESMILWDADKLDALGDTGLRRCIQEAKHKGQSKSTAISHFKRDTAEFKDSMHFNSTREIVKRKVREVKV